MSRPSIRVEEVRGGQWRRLVFGIIKRYHRHHVPPIAWKFGLIAYRGSRLVGVAVVALPKARKLMEQGGFEVTRVCTLPGSASYGACSALYRAAAERGARWTYTLESEHGRSLEAAGWVRDGVTPGGSWLNTKRAKAENGGIQVRMPWEKPEPTGPKQRWRAPIQEAHQ